MALLSYEVSNGHGAIYRYTYEYKKGRSWEKREVFHFQYAELIRQRDKMLETAYYVPKSYRNVSEVESVTVWDDKHDA